MTTSTTRQLVQADVDEHNNNHTGLFVEDCELCQLEADEVLETCTSRGVPAGGVEIETCGQPAVLCVPEEASADGEKQAYCDYDAAIRHLTTTRAL